MKKLLLSFVLTVFLLAACGIPKTKVQITDPVAREKYLARLG